ncbi:MAG: hypothetical protein HY272_07025 [Gammaproteobacteria bacterium]|nr:hypothetical protein [Gammaproteobacteria bacterium]
MFVLGDKGGLRSVRSFQLLPLAVIITSSVLLAACGGGEDAATPSNTTVTSPSGSNANSSNTANSIDPNANPGPENNGFSNVSRDRAEAATTCSGGLSSDTYISADAGGVLDANEKSWNQTGYYIATSGGRGGANGGHGGNGGCVDIFQPGGMGGLKVVAPDLNGNFTKAVTTFTATNTTNANLGSNPLIISQNSTIPVVNSAPANGVAYMVLGNNYVYISDGNATIADEPPVTGIQVKPGTTLTLGLNRGGIDAGVYANIILINDFQNQGTVTTFDASNRRGGLQIIAADYFGDVGSVIDLAGNNSKSEAGSADIVTDFSILSASTIKTSSLAGKNGGNVRLEAQSRIENRGDIIASGGDSNSGTGGVGGAVKLLATVGDLLNSGNITTNGGKGTQAGGDGGDVTIKTVQVGTLKNSGKIITSGGNTDGGQGGDAGDITLKDYGGGVRDGNMVMQVALANSGDLIAVGGSTGGLSSSAGYGGDVTISAYYGHITRAWQTVGHIELSGNINASGGHAAAAGRGNGGDGGFVKIALDARLHSLDQHLSLLGYREINVSGGDGNHGGNAGDVGMMTQFGNTAAQFLTPGGDVRNDAKIIAKGGSVLANAANIPAKGGVGGDVTLETEYYCGMFDVVFYPILGPSIPTMEYTVNKGAIDTSGGVSNGLAITDTVAANAGSVLLWGYNQVSNNNAIVANGADDNGANSGRGGNAGNVSLLTELGDAYNTVNISANGGNGRNRGGDAAALVTIVSPKLVDNGAAVINAKGGNANPAVAGSAGGRGGLIDLYSLAGSAKVTASSQTTFGYTGGTGQSVGASGGVAVGGVCSAGVCK